MQCDNLNESFHNVCEGLTLAVYKSYLKPLSRQPCTLCCSTKSLLILETIELLDIVRKITLDKQPATDEQFSAFEEAEGVIECPVLDLNETIKVVPISVEGGEHGKPRCHRHFRNMVNVGSV